LYCGLEGWVFSRETGGALKRMLMRKGMRANGGLGRCMRPVLEVLKW